jgi:hypothetical protein
MARDMNGNPPSKQLAAALESVYDRTGQTCDVLHELQHVSCSIFYVELLFVPQIQFFSCRR